MLSRLGEEGMGCGKMSRPVGRMKSIPIPISEFDTDATVAE
jgi:hypothetical protein